MASKHVFASRVKKTDSRYLIILLLIKLNIVFSFSRVIVAVRNKGSTRLRLKGFKDVPVGGLEQLLPGGKVRMRSFDRYLLISM